LGRAYFEVDGWVMSRAFVQVEGLGKHYRIDQGARDTLP
jgi:hypothetical protein